MSWLSARLAPKSIMALVGAYFSTAVHNSFYERQKAGKAKQLYLIRLKGRGTFCFAGLWERWTKSENPVKKCTIITTDANELMAPIHDRMPVIVSPADYGLWLDEAIQEPERLTPLLRPYSLSDMEAYPVSTLVNSPLMLCDSEPRSLFLILGS